VIVVVQTDSGGCASNQRSTAGSTAARIMAEEYVRIDEDHQNVAGSAG
jgi:hypothetical protein